MNKIIVYLSILCYNIVYETHWLKL